VHHAAPVVLDVNVHHLRVRTGPVKTGNRVHEGDAVGTSCSAVPWWARTNTVRCVQNLVVDCDEPPGSRLRNHISATPTGVKVTIPCFTLCS
jgi:hypothetical protein